MLELNFNSGSSIYSSQWFACLASHISRSNSPITHPSYSFPFQVRLTSRSDCYRTDTTQMREASEEDRSKIKVHCSIPKYSFKHAKLMKHDNLSFK
ncbi:hypothetical protein YC2023_048857 [Brassica napus]